MLKSYKVKVFRLMKQVIVVDVEAENQREARSKAFTAATEVWSQRWRNVGAQSLGISSIKGKEEKH